MSQQQAGPMLINIPPPPSNPETPSDMPYVIPPFSSCVPIYSE
jgi:hypothetical protein